MHELPCSPWLIKRRGIIVVVFKNDQIPLHYKIETFLFFYIPIILHYFCLQTHMVNTSHYATLSGQCQTRPRCLLIKIETASEKGRQHLLGAKHLICKGVEF